MFNFTCDVVICLCFCCLYILIDKILKKSLLPDYICNRKLFFGFFRASICKKQVFEMEKGMKFYKRKVKTERDRCR